MQTHNVIELALKYAAIFSVANMNDPDEVQAAEELFTYYCRERFTAEEKELVCRVAAEEVQRLRAASASDQEIAFYKGVPEAVHYFDDENNI